MDSDINTNFHGDTPQDINKIIFIAAFSLSWVAGTWDYPLTSSEYLHIHL